MKVAKRTKPDVRAGLATIKEACSFLRVSRASLYRAMDRQSLAYVVVGSVRRIPWEALWNYCQSPVGTKQNGVSNGK